MSLVLTSVETLRKNLEDVLRSKLDKEALENVKMICFDFDSDVYDTINIYFLHDYENYPYLSSNEKIASLKDSSFADLIDTIHCKDDLECYKDDIKLPNHWDTLSFLDPQQDAYYASLLNHWRLTLVRAVQGLTLSYKLGDFAKLVTFSVDNLFSAQHPQIVSVYAKHGHKELFHLEVAQEEHKAYILARIQDDGFYFYAVDSSQEEGFEKIFNSKEKVFFFQLAEVQDFSFNKKGLNQDLRLTNLQGQNFTFRINGAFLGKSSTVEEIFSPSLRSSHAQSEQFFSSIPPCFEEGEKLSAWLESLSQSKIDFGWKDLEKTESKYGIKMVKKILAYLTKEYKYYDAIYKTAVPLLLRHSEFSEAFKAYRVLKTDFQSELFLEYCVILLSLNMDDAFQAFIQERYADEEFYEWRKQILSYSEALWHCRHQREDKAIKILESIPNEDRRSYFPYFAACAYQKSEPELALALLTQALGRYKSYLPIESDFSNEDMIELLKKKSISSQNAKQSQPEIVKVFEKKQVKASKLDLISELTNIYKHHEPYEYLIVSEISPEKVKIKQLFEYGNKHYALSNKGDIFEIIVDDNILELEIKFSLDKAVIIASLFKDKLFLCIEDEGVYIFDLSTFSITSQVYRLYSEEVSNLYVDDDYLCIATLAGVEVYYLLDEDWQFSTLLSAGEKVVDYAWAKDMVRLEEYLYIAGGNAGLLIYKVQEDNSFRYINRICLEGKHPFIDKIQVLDEGLFLQVEKGIWHLGIVLPDAPKPLGFYQPTGISRLKLPLLKQDGKILVCDEEEPVLWELDTKKQSLKPILSRTKKTQNVFYHFYDASIFDIHRALVCTTYGLYLVKKMVAKKLISNLERQLENNFEKLTRTIEEDLQKFSKENDAAISFLEIEDAYKCFEIRLYQKRHLSGMQGYDKKALIEFKYPFTGFDIDANSNKEWPYEDFVTKEDRSTKKKFIQKVFKKLCETEVIKEISNDTLYLLSIYYHEHKDRNSSCVEEVLSF